MVALAEKKRVDISSLSLDELRTVSKAFDESVLKVWNYENSVEQYQVTGGTSRRAVLEQIESLKASLA